MVSYAKKICRESGRTFQYRETRYSREKLTYVVFPFQRPAIIIFPFDKHQSYSKCKTRRYNGLKNIFVLCVCNALLGNSPVYMQCSTG